MQSPERFVSGLYGDLTCTVTVANGVPPSLVEVNWSGSDLSQVYVSDVMINVTNNGVQYTRIILFLPLFSTDAGQYTCSVSVDGFPEADNSESIMIVVNGK